MNTKAGDQEEVVRGEGLSLRDEVAGALDDLATLDEPGEKATTTTTTPGDRDERGRFAPRREPREGEVPPASSAPKKEPREGEVPPASSAPKAPPPGQDGKVPPVTAPRAAPASWRPLAREAWGRLPAEVHEEVHRRETEVQRVLQEAAPVRQYAVRLAEVVAPYAAMIRAEQAQRGEEYDPLRSIGGLLSSAALLRTGGASQKAELVASLISDFGVDLEVLQDRLVERFQRSGGQPGAGAPRPQGGEVRDPRVDQLLADRERERVEAERREEDRVVREVESWGRDKEFFQVLRHDMGVLVALERERGADLSLQEAYDRAALHHPEVSKVLEQRRAVERANSAQAESTRARRAGSSVRPEPAPRAPAAKREASTLREDIEASLSDLEGAR